MRLHPYKPASESQINLSPGVPIRTRVLRSVIATAGVTLGLSTALCLDSGGDSIFDLVSERPLALTILLMVMTTMLMLIAIPYRWIRQKVVMTTAPGHWSALASGFVYASVLVLAARAIAYAIEETVDVRVLNALPAYGSGLYQLLPAAALGVPVAVEAEQFVEQVFRRYGLDR